MSNRRDVLLGVGAGVGVTALSLVAAVRRMRHDMDYQLGEAGETVEGLASAPLRCTAGTVTMDQTEGPFYTPATPLRRDIRDPMITDKTISLYGRVVDEQCRPIIGAALDFWQTDHNGRYDQHAYRYRGHQFTDSNGQFHLVTVRPSQYTAMNIFRTPHIHAKVQGPGTGVLNTQLYMPDAEETNAIDGGYDPALAVRFSGRDGDAQRAVFDFVLARV